MDYIKKLDRYLITIAEFEGIRNFSECDDETRNEICAIMIKCDLSHTEEMLEAMSEVVSDLSLTADVVEGDAAAAFELVAEMQKACWKPATKYVDDFLDDFFAASAESDMAGHY